MTPESAHRRAIALLVLCGLFWSTGGLLLKYVHWHPLAIWSVRSAIAGACLWLLRRPTFRGLSRAEWGAALAFAATTGLFIIANKLTTAANAILIQYSAPIWIALLGAWFLGERASRVDWLTIGLVIGGIVLFFFEDLSVGHAAGNAVALCAGVTFAFSAMAMRRVAMSAASGEAVDPFRPMVLGNLLGAVAGAPFLFVDPLPDATGWGALVALGVVQQAAASICFAWAIRHATAIEAMLIPIIEPVLSPLWVALAVGEIPGPWALVGGGVVVGSVALRVALSRPQGGTDRATFDTDTR